MRKLRLGTVRYLNSVPLLEGITSDERVETLVRDVPAQLARMLAAGELDCALAPVVLLTVQEGLELIDGPVIGCDGAVRTVLLHSQVMPEQLETVQADPASRTSNVLCRVVLERLRDGRPLRVGAYPEALARVVIGDAAFAPAPPGHHHTLDLGEAWKQQTGLPFVFAGWLARGSDCAERAGAVVRDAARRGLSHLGALGRAHAEAHAVDPEVAAQYLEHTIKFELTDAMRQGLALFLEQAR